MHFLQKFNLNNIKSYKTDTITNTKDNLNKFPCLKFTKKKNKKKKNKRKKYNNIMQI